MRELTGNSQTADIRKSRKDLDEANAMEISRGDVGRVTANAHTAHIHLDVGIRSNENFGCTGKDVFAGFPECEPINLMKNLLFAFVATLNPEISIDVRAFCFFSFIIL